MFSTLSMACLRSICPLASPECVESFLQLVARDIATSWWAVEEHSRHQHEQLPISLTSTWVTLTRLLHGQTQAISEGPTQEMRYVLHHGRAPVKHQRQLHGIQTMESCSDGSRIGAECFMHNLNFGNGFLSVTSPLKSEPAILSVSDRSDSNPGRTSSTLPRERSSSRDCTDPETSSGNV